MLRLPMEVEHCRLSASTASAALINGWISSMRMVYAPAPAALATLASSPTTCPPNDSIMRARFLRAKTESSTIRYRTGCPSLRFTAANCSIQPSFYPSSLTTTGSANHAAPVKNSIASGACGLGGLGGDGAGRATAVGAALRLECPGQRIQRDDSGRKTPFDGRLRHAVNHAGIFALGDGQSARGLYSTQSGSAIVAHTRHQ